MCLVLLCKLWAGVKCGTLRPSAYLSSGSELGSVRDDAYSDSLEFPGGHSEQNPLLNHGGHIFFF